MKRTLFQGLVLSLFILAAVPAAAITHNFNGKLNAGTLVNDGSTTRSTDDGIVYTRSGVDVYLATGNPAVIAFNLYDTGDYFTVSPALSHLAEITINHLPASQCKNIAVQLSADGSDWTSITPTVTYNKGSIVLLPPAEGTYYIKVRSTNGSTDVSITQISYNFGDCNCFTYTPE